MPGIEFTVTEPVHALFAPVAVAEATMGMPSSKLVTSFAFDSTNVVAVGAATEMVPMAPVWPRNSETARRFEQLLAADIISTSRPSISEPSSRAALMDSVVTLKSW